MGLFGIKKANEPVKTNTFINNDVINNNQQFGDVVNNVVIGYNSPTQVGDTVMNVANVGDMNNMMQQSMQQDNQTFVVSQVNKEELNLFNTGQNYNNMVNNVPYQGMQYDQSQQIVMQQQVIMQPQMVEQVPNQISVVEQPIVQEQQMVQQPMMPEQQMVEGMPMETQPVVTQPTFDNSALFALPEGAVVPEEPVIDEKASVEEETIVEEAVEEIKLDPLDNANNPVPVNPVAEVEEQIPFYEEEEVKTNLFTVINMMIGVIIKPGITISENAKKYKKTLNALTITVWVTILSFVMCLVGRLIAGCFSKTQNAISGASSISLNFSSLVEVNNYVPYLIVTLLIGLGAILVVSLIYYASSFINSKGIHMGTYFAISTLSLVPVIVAFTILYPIISILSSDLALMILIFSLIYSLIILFTGINEVLVFKSSDGKVIYNSINMALILSTMMFIFNLLAEFNIVDFAFMLK